jgi:hypothetical protein
VRESVGEKERDHGQRRGWGVCGGERERERERETINSMLARERERHGERRWVGEREIEKERDTIKTTRASVTAY